MWREEADRTNLSIPLSSFLFTGKTHLHEHTFYIYMCVCVCFSERQNHARELVREADLSQWDALVIMSGDGLLFEVKRDTRSLCSHPSTHTAWPYVTSHTSVISMNLHVSCCRVSGWTLLIIKGFQIKIYRRQTEWISVSHHKPKCFMSLLNSVFVVAVFNINLVTVESVWLCMYCCGFYDYKIFVSIIYFEKFGVLC